MFMRYSRVLALVGCLVSCGAAMAQDDLAVRQAAAERYLQAVPFSELIDSAMAEAAKQISPNDRAKFLSQVRDTVRIDKLMRISRDAMVKTFTADELNALADFYGSKLGASAMRKFGAYMAEVMPAIMQEVQRAALASVPPPAVTITTAPVPPPPAGSVPRILPSSCAKPQYPVGSLRANEQGTSKIRFSIDADGTAQRFEIVRSSGFPRLDEAAAQALSLCRFAPALKDGKPVQAWALIDYVWRIE